MKSFRTKVEHILSVAGIEINGKRPWDVHVNNENLYPRILSRGSLGVGESYMDGWWDCERLDEFFYRVFHAEVNNHIKNPAWLAEAAIAMFFNPQRPSRAFHIGRHHYDLGNRLYEMMLDRRMIYSCGYWKNASTLDEAQEAKLDLVCKKLMLKPGMRLLDIGCGWGGTAEFAAKNYGVSVVGVTVSKQQYSLAKKKCEGLPIEIHFKDYRKVEQHFDRILSLGMLEHVGCKNYKKFMTVVKNCLEDDGLFLLHTIGGNISVNRTDPWIEKYIFPNSMLPSAKQICAAAEKKFIIEDWHGFGPDYDKTLMCWFENFDRNWDFLKKYYDMRFYRMWKFYLLSCAAIFRARENQVWQIVFSPHGMPGGYDSER